MSASRRVTPNARRVSGNRRRRPSCPRYGSSGGAQPSNAGGGHEGARPVERLRASHWLNRRDDLVGVAVEQRIRERGERLEGVLEYVNRPLPRSQQRLDGFVLAPGGQQRHR
jgi:hypothetical protein